MTAQVDDMVKAVLQIIQADYTDSLTSPKQALGSRNVGEEMVLIREQQQGTAFSECPLARAGD